MLAFVLLEPCAPKGACTVPRGLGAGNRAWLPYTRLARSYMSRIERGKARPTLDTLATLAGGLKVPVKALFEN